MQVVVAECTVEVGRPWCGRDRERVYWDVADVSNNKSRADKVEEELNRKED